MGRGTYGTTALNEELEAHNEGLEIPSAVRRLGRASDTKTRCNEGSL